jgi:hypothetical protein
MVGAYVVAVFAASLAAVSAIVLIFAVNHFDQLSPPRP